MFSSFNKFGSLVTINAKVIITGTSTNIWLQLGSTSYNGTNGTINAVLSDYSNNCIYVGGTFTTVQDTSNVAALSAKYIAKWDIKNNVWRQFGSGSTNGTNALVNALELDSSNNQLYVGGSFTTVQDTTNTVALSAKYVARWDISNNIWRQLGSGSTNGTNNAVNALALDSSNSQLYVGGTFTTVQDISNTVALSTNRVARWDISTNVWRQLGNTTYNGTNSTINALALDSSNLQLYVGGAFTTASDTVNSKTRQYIASYNYATNVIDSLSSTGISYTNGSTSANIFDYKNNCIYVGGTFTIVYDSSNVNGLAANNIAKWDISNNVWRQLGNTTNNGANSTVQAFALDSSNNQLYVGGNFTTVRDTTNTGGLSAKYFARWDISNNIWKQLGNTTYNGGNGQIYSMVLDSSNQQLYAVGGFNSVSDPSNTSLSAKYVVRWDISFNCWRTLGTSTSNGLESSATALALDHLNMQLYVLGNFISVNDATNTTALSAKYIARWDISNNIWRQLGSNASNGVNAASGSNGGIVFDSARNMLYVGGAFTIAYDSYNTNGLTVNRIAKWDISNNIWSQFGNNAYSGVNGAIYTIAYDSSNSQLYIGGNTTSFNDPNSKSIIVSSSVGRWDIINNSWNLLGISATRGVGGNVLGLTWNPYTLTLYISGSFSTVNSIITFANRIVRWDISNNVWKQLGGPFYNGTNGTVKALNVFPSTNKLYVGGDFTSVQDTTNINSLPANYVAEWDISKSIWNVFGNNTYNGTTSTVNAFAIDNSNGQLYVGGAFTNAYDTTSIDLFSKYIFSYNYSTNTMNTISTNGFGFTNGTVLTSLMDYSNNCIYVGGTFTSVYDSTNVNGLPANNIAIWDLSNNVWELFGNTIYNGTSNTVNALALDSSNNQLYIGGAFFNVRSSNNNITANYIARWDISNNIWKQLGNTYYNGTSNTVNALALDPSNMQLYVGGSFTSVQDTINIGGLTAYYAAIWDISNNIWKQIGKGMTNGTSAAVNALAFDSSNTQLYVGGTFTTASDASNTLFTQYIGSYNYLTNLMSNIATSGSGFTNGTVMATKIDYLNNCIYVGGTFTIVYDLSNISGLFANNIARWDISNNVWRQFGNSLYNGTNGTVNSLELDSFNNQLYVGGSFTKVQDTTNIVALSTKYVAMWDLSSNVWRQLGYTNTNGINSSYNGTSGIVYGLALDISNSLLYIGGNFNYVYDSININGLKTNNLAVWNIAYNSWKKMQPTYLNGTSGTVQALILDSSNSQLYVGGSFTTIIGTNTSALNIASYDYSSNIISNIATSGYGVTNHTVNATVIDYSNNCIYVGGNFTKVYDLSNSNGLNAYGIAKWDISKNVWNTVGGTGNFNGVGGHVNSLIFDNSNNLYVVGNFASINYPGSSICSYNFYKNEMTPIFKNGMCRIRGNVYAIAKDYKRNLYYIGGTFVNSSVADSNSLDITAIDYLATWDISNNSWKPFNTYGSPSGNVNALVMDYKNDIIYVGGSFTTVTDYTGSINSKYVVKYDLVNNTWKPLGSTTYNGTNASVNTLALDSSNNQLYVGGTFTTVQDTTNITALTANYVARWDVSNNIWKQFGNTTSNGTNAAVNALTFDSSNNQLYVGGTFTTVRDVSNNTSLSAKYVARWDISNNVWRQLGSGTNNGTNTTVRALTFDSSNNQLYVGGDFTTVQDISNAVALSAKYVARWDISNNVWRQLGSGTNNGTNTTVRALTFDSSNNQLYVGGDFTTVRDVSNITDLSANYVARWDISNNVWRLCGDSSYNGTRSTVYVMTMDSDPYMGGDFTAINEPSSDNVLECYYGAAWNSYTNTWSYLSGYSNSISKTGSNFPFLSKAIVSNNNLYIIGGHTQCRDRVGFKTTGQVSMLNLSTQIWTGYTGAVNQGSLPTDIVIDTVRNQLYIAWPGMVNSTSGVVSLARLDLSTNVWSLPFTVQSFVGYGYALAIDSSCNYLYFGGNFSSIIDLSGLSTTVNNIAILNLSTNKIIQLGNTTNNGTNGQVNSLTYDSSNNQLYVGGAFTTVRDISNTTGLNANYVARWDISNNVWRQIGNTTYNGVTATSPVSANVKSLIYNSLNNKLYVGGTFTAANNSSQTNSANRIVRFDISNNSFEQFGNEIYNGTNNTVNALAVDSSNNQLYVGGSFTTVQDISNTIALSAKYATRWDISNNVWRQLGNTTYNGTNGVVNSLTIDPSNSQLYVGGAFTSVQDLSNTVALSANYAVRWDISNNVWRRLGNASYNGTNTTVNTVMWNPLTSSLYLGGSFTSINLLLLNAANRIARYDVLNNVWRQLGNNSYNGTNNTVNTLAIDSSNSQLYVGGAFTTAQDISNVAALSTKYVAGWDISNNVWRQFGNTTYNGTNATTRTLAVDSSNNQIYVGGDFTTVQDISNTTALTVNYTARWNISNNAWNRIGNTTNNGTNGTVNTMSWNPLSTTLYVGGSFTKANYYINTKSLNNYITEWDISNNYWNPVGNILYNGTNTTVNAVELDISNNQLYVGGSFATVKDTKNTTGLSAKSIAKWAI